MKKYTLLEAIVLICQIRNLKQESFTAIGFEGSTERKFWYTVRGNDRQESIDFTGGIYDSATMLTS